jgi:hypothetical protein
MKSKFFQLFLYSFVLLFIISNHLTLFAQTITVSNAGTAAVRGVYVNKGLDTDNTHDYYMKLDGSMYIYFAGGYWNIYTARNDGSTDYYYWNFTPLDPNPPTLPIGGPNGWSYVAVLGTGPGAITKQNANANMTFANGSGYTPSTPTRGTSNNPVGRFQLTGSRYGGILDGLTISLSGTRTGVSNIKLWAGSVSGSPLATVATDNTTITFNNFYSLVDSSSGTIYYVTIDLTAGATGSVTPTIPSQASFTFAGANVPSSFTSAPLSSGSAPLPVELNSFNAVLNGNSVALNWSTATEVNNYGFNIERKPENGSWNKIGFVQGHGNSNSPKSYSFIDDSPPGGKLSYRLQQIDLEGVSKNFDPVNVSFEIPKSELKQNYPNPFNPSTVITYNLSTNSYVSLKIYDVLGNQVAVVANGFQNAGIYNIKVDASDFKLSSGIYFYKLITDKFIETKKMILTK